MTTPVHPRLARSALLGWACAIIGCDTARRPKACVLLILSVLMMLLTIITVAAVGP